MFSLTKITSGHHTTFVDTGGDRVPRYSLLLFQVGLALITFEQLRPFFEIQLSDYLFALSYITAWRSLRTRLMTLDDSGVMLAGYLIMLGAAFSLLNTSSLGEAVGPIARFLALFMFIAPLTIIHSKSLENNLRWLTAGIVVNCAVAVLQASIFPDIAEVLSINPTQPDISEVSNRFQGLTSHPNILGLSAALALFINFGFFLLNTRKYRWQFWLSTTICSLGALFSGSRTSFATFVPAALVFICLRRPSRQVVFRFCVGVAILAVTITYIAPTIMSQFTSRMDSRGEVYDADYGRYWSAVETLLEISQRPILGWGMDHYQEAGITLVPTTGEITGVHDVFLKYWHGAGILGAFGFLLLFFMPALKMLKVKNTDERTKGLLQLGISCYVLLFIASNLGPFDYNRFVYVPLFVFAGFLDHCYLSRSNEKVPATVLSGDLNLQISID